MEHQKCLRLRKMCFQPTQWLLSAVCLNLLNLGKTDSASGVVGRGELGRVLMDVYVKRLFG